jgi:hypothetical protein
MGQSAGLHISIIDPLLMTIASQCRLFQDMNHPCHGRSNMESSSIFRYSSPTTDHCSLETEIHSGSSAYVPATFGGRVGY